MRNVHVGAKAAISFPLALFPRFHGPTAGEKIVQSWEPDPLAEVLPYSILCRLHLAELDTVHSDSRRPLRSGTGVDLGSN